MNKLASNTDCSPTEILFAANISDNDRRTNNERG